MTLKDVVNSESIEAGTYNIGFNQGDETQFDVENFDELQECWLGFCKDERILPDCVDYVDKDITSF